METTVIVLLSCVLLTTVIHTIVDVVRLCYLVEIGSAQRTLKEVRDTIKEERERDRC